MIHQSGLELFLSAYLHPEWEEEFSDEWAALDRFVADSPGQARQLPEEIDRVLATCPSDEAIVERLIELGASLLGPTAEGSVRTWLEQIAERARHEP